MIRERLREQQVNLENLNCGKLIQYRKLLAIVQLIRTFFGNKNYRALINQLLSNMADVSGILLADVSSNLRSTK